MRTDGQHAASLNGTMQAFDIEPGRDHLGELLLTIGVSADELPHGPGGHVVSLRRVKTGGTLFHEGDPLGFICFVRSGTFKVYRTAEDGHEQVLSFAVRSDMLGFDAMGSGHHPAAAVALEESSLFMMSVAEFSALERRLPTFVRAVHLAASRQLLRYAELADLMAGGVAADVRLARFLLQLSRRMADCGMARQRFHLRISRRDIASHLGVVHETVSRSFGMLADLGYLQVHHRDIVILDMAGLSRFARSSRGQIDEAVSVRRDRRVALLCPNPPRRGGAPAQESMLLSSVPGTVHL